MKNKLVSLVKKSAKNLKNIALPISIASLISFFYNPFNSFKDFDSFEGNVFKDRTWHVMKDFREYAEKNNSNIFALAPVLNHIYWLETSEDNFEPALIAYLLDIPEKNCCFNKPIEIQGNTTMNYYPCAFVFSLDDVSLKDNLNVKLIKFAKEVDKKEFKQFITSDELWEFAKEKLKEKLETKEEVFELPNHVRDYLKQLPVT